MEAISLQEFAHFVVGSLLQDLANDEFVVLLNMVLVRKFKVVVAEAIAGQRQIVTQSRIAPDGARSFCELQEFALFTPSRAGLLSGCLVSKNTVLLDRRHNLLASPSWVQNRHRVVVWNRVKTSRRVVTSLL